jgi:rRNA maturation RNase YbeY
VEHNRICVTNCHHGFVLDEGLLRRITFRLLEIKPMRAANELGICLVDQSEIARLNQVYLHHAGPTDVITFDYGGGTGSALHGDIYICLDLVVTQARRFDATWQSELVRYVVHGLLHLVGHEDRTAAARRIMKRQEDRLLNLLARDFDFCALGVLKRR